MLGAKEGVAAVALSTAQIGKCGELLVQYRLGLSDFLCVRRVSFTPHSD